MQEAKVQASLRIRAVSPEPSLLAHTSSESRGTFRQKARSLAPLNVWACAVKICHDGMLEDTNSLDAAQMFSKDARSSFEPHHVKMCLRTFSTRYDSNRSAQLQRLARVLKGHLCLWREDSLKEKYNTKYYKTYFLCNFPCMQIRFDGQKHIFGKFYSG